MLRRTCRVFWFSYCGLLFLALGGALLWVKLHDLVWSFPCLLCSVIGKEGFPSKADLAWRINTDCHLWSTISFARLRAGPSRKWAVDVRAYVSGGESGSQEDDVGRHGCGATETNRDSIALRTGRRE